ncbi:MAG: YqgE/AlgH family protein [Gammaproteobacteria bacterium]|nr:YqgE/AlgH family protein [Gammaproteobacteria bacterium]
MNTGHNLRGHLLIAMPGLDDPNFDHTVTYLLEHNSEGAFGLIINRPIELDMGDILEQLKITSSDPQLNAQPVMSGGPVQPERGFLLHPTEPSELPKWDSTARFDDGISVTTSPDILTALANGNGPGDMLFVLGYAGWEAGQLETEIVSNAWLSVEATPQILFEVPLPDRWAASARLLGVDPAAISPEAGHA